MKSASGKRPPDIRMHLSDLNKSANFRDEEIDGVALLNSMSFPRQARFVMPEASNGMVSGSRVSPRDNHVQRQLLMTTRHLLNHLNLPTTAALLQASHGFV